MMNATVIVALLAALAAIVSPLITSFIQNRYSLKEKQLDIIYQKKLFIYQDFSSKYGALEPSNPPRPIMDFRAAAYSVMLLADQQSNEYIAELVTYVSSKYGTDQFSNDTFQNCCLLLNNDLQLTRN